MVVVITLLMMALAGICLWGAINPRSLWRKTSAWSYRDPLANEPSDKGYGSMRLQGIVGFVLFLVLIPMVVMELG